MEQQYYTFTGEYITLGQMLKACSLALSGGEAKALLASGAVLVNGETETRRGRKLRHGDLVVFGASRWQMLAESNRV